MAKNKYTNIDLDKYSKGYQASDYVKAAEARKTAAENAVKNYGDFSYAKQNAYDNAMNSYLNREDFKYDLNADALYQQYKNHYATLGKMAMMDTMGQATALTGGYGNSWAQNAGQQAYQGYLQNINDVIPELYQLALSKYNADGDRLLNNYNMLSQDRATEYGEWGDKYNKLVADRGYYADSYADAYTRDYGKWNDNRTYDTNQYWNEYDAGYKVERDRIADDQWKKNYDLDVANQDLAQKKMAADLLASGLKLDSKGNVIVDTNSAYYEDDDAFSRYEYARKDKDGNYVFYRDGKEYTYAPGVNPYTNTKNPDAMGEGNAFSNGYQPNNIGGKKLKAQAEYEVYVNGIKQKVWSYDNGKTLWAWDGTLNEYIDITSQKDELKK